MSSSRRANVFITGATKGIGKATAEYFHARGFGVAAAGRSIDLISHMANESFVPVRCDVTDQESVEKAVEEARAALGPIAIVVNNAGFGIPAPLDVLTTEELAGLFEVNVFGAHRVIRATVEEMKRSGHGRIVNVSSAAGRIVTPNLGAYCASKFALEALSDAWRIELRAHGIEMSIVEPGPIATSFGERSESELRRIVDRIREEDPARAAELFRYNRESRGALDRFRKDAGSVARVIFLAATTRHPKARYRVTLPAWAAEVGRLLPTRFTDAAMRRFVARATARE